MSVLFREVTQEVNIHADRLLHCLCGRYYILNPNVIPKGFVDNKKASELILGSIGLDDMEYRIGHTKVVIQEYS